MLKSRKYILEEISKVKDNLRSNNSGDVIKEIIKLETYLSFLALRLYSYRFVRDIHPGNYDESSIDRLCRALEEAGLKADNIEKEFLSILENLQSRNDDLLVNVEDCRRLVSDVVVAAIEYLCGEAFRKRWS